MWWRVAGPGAGVIGSRRTGSRSSVALGAVLVVPEQAAMIAAATTSVATDLDVLTGSL